MKKIFPWSFAVLLIVMLLIIPYSVKAIDLTPNGVNTSFHKFFSLDDSNALIIYEVDSRLVLRLWNETTGWQEEQVVFSAESNNSNHSYEIFTTKESSDLTAIVLQDGDEQYKLVTYSAGIIDLIDLPETGLANVISSNNALLLIYSDHFFYWNSVRGFSDAITFYSESGDEYDFLLNDNGIVGQIFIADELEGGDVGENTWVQTWDSQNNFSTTGPQSLLIDDDIQNTESLLTTKNNDLLFAVNSTYTDDESGFHHNGSYYLVSWSLQSGWRISETINERKIQQALSIDGSNIKLVLDYGASYDTLEDYAHYGIEKDIYKYSSDKGWEKDLSIATKNKNRLITINNNHSSQYYAGIWVDAINTLQIDRWKSGDGWEKLPNILLDCSDDCDILSVDVSKKGKIFVTWIENRNLFAIRYLPSNNGWGQPKQINVNPLKSQTISLDGYARVITSRGNFISLWTETASDQDQIEYNDDIAYSVRWTPNVGWGKSKLFFRKNSWNDQFYSADGLIMENTVLFPVIRKMNDIDGYIFKTSIKGRTKKQKITDSLNESSITAFFGLQKVGSNAFAIYSTSDDHLIVKKI